MSIFDIFKRKAAAPPMQPLYGVTFAGAERPAFAPRNYDTISKRFYGNNIYLFKACNEVATACAGISWKSYTDKTKKREVKDSAALKLLDKPKEGMSRSELIENLVLYWILSGNAYLYGVGPSNRTSPPKELYALRPDRVSVLADSGGITGYEYRVDMGRQEFPLERMMHLKMFNPQSDYYGLSPVAVAAAVIETMNEGNDWNMALLQNAGRPSGALITQGVLSDDAYLTLRKRLKEAYMSTRNAGRPMILDGGIDWKQFSMSPLDLDWLAGKQQNAREIAIAIGVPPELIGDNANKTYSNYKEARRAFYEETVLNVMDKLRDKLNMFMGQWFDEYLDYDKDDIEALAEDRDSIAARANSQYQAGYMMMNEARKAAGLDELPEGNVFVKAPSGYVDAEGLKQAVSPQPMPAPLAGGKPQQEQPQEKPAEKPAPEEAQPGQKPTQQQEGQEQQPQAQQNGKPPKQPAAGKAEIENETLKMLMAKLVIDLAEQQELINMLDKPFEFGQDEDEQDEDGFKFNPHHDRLGRFASGGATGGLISDVGSMSFLSAEQQQIVMDFAKEHGIDFDEAVKTGAGYIERSKEAGYYEADADWYNRANMASNALAKRYGVSLEQSSAVIAAMSPQSKWDEISALGKVRKGNLQDALTIVKAWKSNPEIEVTQQMVDTLNASFKKRKTFLVAGEKKRLQDFTPNQIGDLLAPHVRGYPANTAKSVRILAGESVDAVLGGPKVRSFYNNVHSPDFKGPVTIDTWMVRVLNPVLKHADPRQASQILSSPQKGGLKGVGTYPLMAEMVTTIAKQYNIAPHEAQAAMWQQARRENGFGVDEP